MKKRSSTKVVVNAENWSAASKRSWLYVSSQSHYSDIEYKCYRCKKTSIFSAEDQRVTFEVRKEYVWQRRLLCADCMNEKRELEKEAKKFNQLWINDRKSIEGDVLELKRWLEVLQKLPYYGSRKNRANIAMLERIITNAA